MLSAFNCLHQRKKNELRLHGEFRLCPETVTHFFIFQPNQEFCSFIQHQRGFWFCFKKEFFFNFFLSKTYLRPWSGIFLPKMFWNNLKKSESAETDKKQILKTIRIPLSYILTFSLQESWIRNVRKICMCDVIQFLFVPELDSLTKSSDSCREIRARNKKLIQVQWIFTADIDIGCLICN
jgi:hypothetical protein